MTPNPSTFPAWRKVKLPESVLGAKTMLMRSEQKMLYALARDYFQNEGCIVDGGCFLGGSTLALAHGLAANPNYQSNPRGAVINSYDLFVVEPWTIGVYFPEGTPLETSFEPIFRDNIKAVSNLVKIHPGDVTKSEVPNDPIEILFIDLAKHWNVSDYLVRSYFPKLIAGHSIVVQQDYLYASWTGWLPVTMEYFADYFEIVDYTIKNSVVFRYHTKIPDEMLNINVIASLTRGEIKELSNRAIARFVRHQNVVARLIGYQANILKRSRDHFQDVLVQQNWPA